MVGEGRKVFERGLQRQAKKLVRAGGMGFRVREEGKGRKEEEGGEGGVLSKPGGGEKY